MKLPFYTSYIIDNSIVQDEPWLRSWLDYLTSHERSAVNLSGITENTNLADCLKPQRTMMFMPGRLYYPFQFFIILERYAKVAGYDLQTTITDIYEYTNDLGLVWIEVTIDDDFYNQFLLAGM